MSDKPSGQCRRCKHPRHVDKMCGQCVCNIDVLTEADLRRIRRDMDALAISGPSRSVHPSPPTPESGPRPCTEHEYLCYKCGEAEQGQAALELVLDIAAKERPEVLNARFIWRRSKEILEGEK